jgi:hypothetical protein
MAKNVRFARDRKPPISASLFEAIKGGDLDVELDWLFEKGSLFGSVQKPSDSDELLNRPSKYQLAPQTTSDDESHAGST